jgi:hypothetical protein
LAGRVPLIPKAGAGSDPKAKQTISNFELHKTAVSISPIRNLTSSALKNRTRETERRIHDRNMSQCLRKISCKMPSFKVVFFRKKAEVISYREHALERFAGLLPLPLHSKTIREPACAREKGALINFLTRRLSHDEAISDQVPLDRSNGADNSWIIGR